MEYAQPVSCELCSEGRKYPKCITTCVDRKKAQQFTEGAMFGQQQAHKEAEECLCISCDYYINQICHLYRDKCECLQLKKFIEELKKLIQ